MRRKGSVLGKLAGALAILGIAAGIVWLAWYGYEDSRATTRGLNVIGLLRDVQTCVGISFEAHHRRLAPGQDFAAIPRMRATPYAGRLDWDVLAYRATATFTDTHPDYDRRTLWTAARIDANGALHWTCGTTVDPSARSYRNVAEFIARCERPLVVDSRLIDYCAAFVPLPARKFQ